MEVVDRADVLDCLPAKLIGRAMVPGPLHSGAGQPDGEPGRIVVTAAGPLLEGRHSAKLGHEGDERIVQQPAGFEIEKERRGRLVEDRGVDGILVDECLVAIPVPHPFPHRIGAVEELYEPHPLLEKFSGQDAVAGEAGLGGVGGVVSAVAGERRG